MTSYDFEKAAKNAVRKEFANKGKHNHKASEATKDKMSKIRKGKKHSATHKNNISKALTERKLSEFS